MPSAQISAVLNGLQILRFTDDTIYLCSASLNIFNGLISRMFSCDGSGYMLYSEFFDKVTLFWFDGEG